MVDLVVVVVVKWLGMMDIVVDWLMNLVVVLMVVVNGVMVIVVDVSVVVLVVVVIVVVIVVSVNVMSWLSNMRSRVIVVVVTGDDWVNSVLFSVLVLSGVGIFVVLSMSEVSVSWLSVGVLMNINNFVVVVVVWVMRISGWVGVDSLVVVMDCFVINWLNLVGLVFLKIVGDSLMWHSHVPFRSVMLMVIVWVSIVVMIMRVVSVLESNSAVFIIMVEGAVIDFMISFVVNELVSHGVVLSFPTLYMWLDFVNACLLERSMV